MLSADVEYDVKDWLQAVEVVLDENVPAEDHILNDKALTGEVVSWIYENAKKAIKLKLPSPAELNNMRMISLISMDLRYVVLDKPEKYEHYLVQFAKISSFVKKILQNMELKEEFEALSKQGWSCEKELPEEQKIRQLIEEHQEFLKKQGMDVAQSIIENKWYCYQFDKQYKCYNFFTEFTTARELADIILNQMAVGLELEEGKEAYQPVLKNSNIADVVTAYYSHNYILVLEKLLQRVLNTKLGENSEFFKALDQLVTGARKENV